MWNFIQPLLAEAEQVVAKVQDGAADPNAQGDPPPYWISALPWIAIPVLMYFFMIRPSVNQQRQAQDRISKLKENDRVLTKAGIYGTIYSIDKDKNVATIKIDEATNTKIDVTLSSIEVAIDESSEKAKDKA